jgi:hypothetical protein
VIPVEVNETDLRRIQVTLDPFVTVGNFTGRIADLNVWNQPLSKRQGSILQNFTAAKKFSDQFSPSNCAQCSTQKPHL